MELLFDHAVSRIEEFYEKAAYTQGWSFLYTSRATIECPNGLMFVGLNPGGADAMGSAHPSSEEGNAYRIESWANGAKNALQHEVEALFEAIRLTPLVSGAPTLEQIFDQTLTANLCPFRSASWNQLRERDAAIRFSKDLWQDLIAKTRPRVIFAMGASAYWGFASVLEGLGGDRSGGASFPTGWGKARFRVRTFSGRWGRTVLAGLPHLSRYRVMTHANSAPQVERLIDYLVEKAIPPTRLRSS